MATQIIVSGIGAIGGYYGGMIARFTEQLKTYRTHFFMRKNEHMRTVAGLGLHVTSPTLDFFAHPTSVHYDVDNFPKADFLFLCSKGYDVADNLEQLAPLITKHTIIITTQNGLSIPELVHERFPRCLIVAAACHITGRRSEPGLISIRSDHNLLKLGPLPSLKESFTKRNWERLEDLYLLLSAASINCRLYPDMAPLLREKFIMLSPSAASTSYFDAPIGKVMAEHDSELRELIRELAMLYRAMGSSNDLFIEEEAYEAVDKMPKEATTSMHSDIVSGHRSELEMLVGFVVKRAKKLGVEVPLYRAYYDAIKERISEQKAKKETS